MNVLIKLRDHTLNNVMFNICVVAMLAVFAVNYWLSNVWWLTFGMAACGIYMLVLASYKLFNLPSENLLTSWTAMNEYQKINELFKCKIHYSLTNMAWALLWLSALILVRTSSHIILGVSVGIVIICSITGLRTYMLKKQWENLQQSVKSQYFNNIIQTSNELSKQIKERKT